MAGLKYWVWLNECRGLTNRSRALLLDHFGSPEDVYYADEAEYALVEGLSKKQFELLADKSTDGADKILGDCQRLGLRILTMQDAGLSRAAARHLRAALPSVRQGHAASVR